MHISEAFVIARQFNCPPPICEQMEYHMFVRDKMELQMLELFHKSGIGCITWSPNSLHNDEGITLINRRMNLWDSKYYNTIKCNELIKLCERLGCDLTQLSLGNAYRSSINFKYLIFYLPVYSLVFAKRKCQLYFNHCNHTSRVVSKIKCCQGILLKIKFILFSN